MSPTLKTDSQYSYNLFLFSIKKFNDQQTNNNTKLVGKMTK